MSQFRFSFAPYTLHFKEPGGTSRGVLREKLTYFLRVESSDIPGLEGFGEVPVFPGLSSESIAELETQLKQLAAQPSAEILPAVGDRCSSLVFGLESAFADIKIRENGILFPSPFTAGETSITINGLIWMGTLQRMIERVNEKIEDRFRCIKLKIGAINWKDELDLIRYIRSRCGSEVIIRVDANGAFHPSDCMGRLETLASLGVHSIEQPIRAGNWEAMGKLCRESPLPIALDEELIGISIGQRRKELLEFIRPQYLILKPALCYGFSGAANWIELAEKENIGWWVTSALESSVGLNAIAQFTATYAPAIPQGLGTGNLFTNNFVSPLILTGDEMKFDPDGPSYRTQLKELKWITQ